MKKAIVFILAVMLCPACFTVTFASESEVKPIDELLASYIEVIDKVNAENGVQLYIPAGKEECVYAHLKDYSLEEFEKTLLDELSSIGTYPDSFPDGEMEGELFPASTADNSLDAEQKSIVEDITQTAQISYNSYITLSSTVFGGGNPLVYHYQSINGVDVDWPSGFTGFHFAVSSWSYKLSNNNKTCTATVVGSPQNASGLTLLVQLHETVTFNAN